MKKVAIAPKINPLAAEFYKKNFKNLNSGTTTVLEALPDIYAVEMAAAVDYLRSSDFHDIISDCATTGKEPGNHRYKRLSTTCQIVVKMWAREVWKQSDKTISTYVYDLIKDHKKATKKRQKPKINLDTLKQG